jgi:hypothetical protein
LPLATPQSLQWWLAFQKFNESKNVAPPNADPAIERLPYEWNTNSFWRCKTTERIIFFSYWLQKVISQRALSASADIEG